MCKFGVIWDIDIQSFRAIFIDDATSNIQFWINSQSSIPI